MHLYNNHNDPSGTGSPDSKETTDKKLWKQSISSEVFNKPLVLPQSAWTEHIPFAFWLIDSLKPGVFAELGTHYGLSYFSFCQAIANSGLKTKSYAVDTWQGDEHSGYYDNAVFEYVTKTNELYADFSTLYRSTFDEAVSLFEDTSIDLLHIDGLHTYEAVKHDFNKWLPKVSKKGVVLFHDTNVLERGFGVYRFWEELTKQYPHFEFKHGFGLGVLGVGIELPDAVKLFFETASIPEVANDIRKVYERLGFLYATEKELDNAYHEIQLGKNARSLLDEEISNLKLETNKYIAEIDLRKTIYQEERERLISESRSVTEQLYAEKESLLVENKSIANRLNAEKEELLSEIKFVTDRLHAEKEKMLSEINSITNRLYSEKESQLAKSNSISSLLHDEKINSANLLQEIFRNKESYNSSIARLEHELQRNKAEAVLLTQELNNIKRSPWWKTTNSIRANAHKISNSPPQVLLKKLARSAKWTLTFKRKEYKELLKVERNVALIRESGLFDNEWYLDHYSDVKKANMDPVLHYLHFGAAEGRNPNPHFNTLWYLRKYPDVAESGKNPFIHFIEFGKSENRYPNPNYDYFQRSDVQPGVEIPPPAPLIIQAPESGANSIELPGTHSGYRASISPLKLYKVIYVTGFPNSPSHKYRVYDQVACLNQSGITAAWIDASEVSAFLHMLTFAEIVVLFRVVLDPALEIAVEACKQAGVLIAYDTDDYIFDPAVANEKHVDGIRFLSDKDIITYHTDIIRYKEAMMLCDAGIYTTETLSKAGETLGLKTYIIKNGISEQWIKSSESALKSYKKNTADLYIGYASGSLTHQKDFAVAVPALVKVLAQYEHVKLKIIGFLNLDEFPELKTFRNKIEILPLVPLDQLPFEMVKFDINIAPLEAGNPFCEAKSELKYFDAAALKIPTVASATSPYKKAITNGENGFTVLSETEWVEALQALITDKNRRDKMGETAHEHALANYGAAAKKNEVDTVFNELFTTRKIRFLNNNKYIQLNQTITIMTCAMDKGSGGHAIIIDMAKWLVNLGHTITINFTSASMDYPTSDKIEKEFNFDTSRMRALFGRDIPAETNAVFATFWTTVYDIEKSKIFAGRRYYMLLDYEPYFYPMSTEYILAMNTYAKNFNRISWGPWIKNLLLKRHNIDNTRTFPLYYNKQIYTNNENAHTRNKNKILFFGRPSMPRRCFDLGVQVLHRYRELYGDGVEIVFFGALATKNRHIPFKHTDLGVLTPEQLANLYQSATLGIVFSPTNPSKAPYEMMACGLPVLDLDVEGNEANYGDRDNVFLISPDPDNMAKQINLILNDDLRRHLVAENGEKYVAQFPDEAEAAKKLFDILHFDASTIATYQPEAYVNHVQSAET